MEPLITTGDGNCLFNSISLLISGKEELGHILRVMSFFYAAQNLSILQKWVCFRGPQNIIFSILTYNFVHIQKTIFSRDMKEIVVS